MEVLVSALLITMVLAGMASIFITGKRYILHSRARMTGGEVGRVFLDPLQMYVVESETSPGADNGWDGTNNLLRIPIADDSRSWAGSQQRLNNIDYTPNYTVSRVRDAANQDTGLRRVVVSISWTELEP